ncbi:uncharacterized protein LOC117779812 [Drosophila innubila]|uniref:uncharacterized protein LOC117779812 n=1 Tax=Drosophila innubila TaxID=198719 RepID=UPI00148DA567|nr:uncharacterized protein LOC117779812 [Drosophila innubila]
MGSCLGSCLATTDTATATATTTTTNSASNSNSNSNSNSAASSSSSTSSSTNCDTPAANSWYLWRCPRTRGRARAAARDEPEVELLSTASERCQRRGLVYRILKFKRKQQCPQFLDRYWDQQPSYAKLQNDSALTDIQLQNLDVHKLVNATATSSQETEMQSYVRLAGSRASSSLDLEWEHEYSQLRHYQQRQQKEKEQQHQQPLQDTPPMVASQARYASLDQLTTTASQAVSQGRHHSVARLARMGGQRYGGSFTRTSCCSSTQNSWSHISTPESLEWDIDAEQEQQRQLRQEDDSLDEDTLKLLHQIEQLKHHVLQETGDGLSMGAGPAMAVGVAVEELTDGLQFRASHFGVANAHLS